MNKSLQFFLFNALGTVLNNAVYSLSTSPFIAEIFCGQIRKLF